MTHNETRLFGALACAICAWFFIDMMDHEAGFTMGNIWYGVLSAGSAVIFATFALGEFE